MSFTTVIEDIQSLPLEDKIKVRSLLDKYLIEEKRDRLYKSYKHSLKRAEAGSLNFTSDIDELINSVNE
jgi:hypothetical protein